MNEKEYQVSHELSGDEKDSFLYRLAREQFWCAQAYGRFISVCHSLLDVYNAHGKTAYTSELLKLLTERLIYISQLIYCHYSDVDLFTIHNWSRQMEEADFPDFFESFHEISAKIFSISPLPK